jgi:SAM-dependent methyltransferase
LKRFAKANASGLTYVLDVGAGGGEDLSIVRGEISDSNLHACEWDVNNCRKLRSMGAQVFQCDLERDQLPYGDEEFDLIIADQIYEHIKDIFWLSHEISRILKVGGFLYISVPNLASFHNRVLLMFGKQPTSNYSVGPHVRVFTVGDLDKFIKAGNPDGWELHGIGGSNWYPFPKPISTVLARLFPKAAVGITVIFSEGNSDRTSWKVASSFFYSRSKNPILVDSIESILHNVQNRYYGHDAHFIGGPSVFGRSVAKYGLELDLYVGQYYWFKYRRNKYVLPDGTVAARHKHGGAFQGGNSGLVGGNNYNEIWKSKVVYGENTDF